MADVERKALDLVHEVVSDILKSRVDRMRTVVVKVEEEYDVDRESAGVVLSCAQRDGEKLRLRDHERRVDKESSTGPVEQQLIGRSHPRRSLPPAAQGV